MRIALIWPNGFNTKMVIPLSLGFLKSNINNRKHKVKIIDCSLHNISIDSPEFQQIIEDFDPQLIGVSSWHNTYEEAMRIIEKVKFIKNNVITVMGGISATVNALTIIQNKNVDFVFRGEAELTFSKFVDELQKKQKQADFSKIDGLTYRSKKGKIINNNVTWEKDLDRIKIPDYDAIDLNGYIQDGYKYVSSNKYNAPIWVTRGCPYACGFCLASHLNARLVRQPSVGHVVRWIKYLYYQKHIRYINIIDDNFTYNVEFAKKVCRKIIKLNLKDLKIGTPNGIRFQRSDAELFKLMKQAGWEFVVVAPESGSVKTLEKMGKHLDLADLPGKVKEIKEAGLKCIGFFIVGYPGETRKDIEETVQLIRRTLFDYFFLFSFQPLPGTPIFNELVDKKEIPADFIPKSYTGGQISYVPKALKDFNFPLLRLREYMLLVIRNPTSLQFFISHFNPIHIVAVVFSNFVNTLRLNHLFRKTCI